MPTAPALLGGATAKMGGRGPPVTDRHVIQSAKSMESAGMGSVSVSRVGRENTALLVCLYIGYECILMDLFCGKWIHRPIM